MRPSLLHHGCTRHGCIRLQLIDLRVLLLHLRLGLRRPVRRYRCLLRQPVNILLSNPHIALALLQLVLELCTLPLDQLQLFRVHLSLLHCLLCPQLTGR